MSMICNQICEWNDPSDGCVKPPAGFCPMSNVSAYQKPMTNADRIRAMSDEELAKFIMYGFSTDFYGTLMRDKIMFFSTDSLMEWLKQPAQEGE